MASSTIPRWNASNIEQQPNGSMVLYEDYHSLLVMYEQLQDSYDDLCTKRENENFGRSED